MPRKSAEEQAAARFRGNPTGQHPQPPAGMPAPAAGIWREIVEARAVDYFKPGSLHLLEQFCRLVIVQRYNMDILDLNPGDDEALSRVTKASASLTTLATKLRLSIQASVGQSTPERGTARLEEAPPKLDDLLGGRPIEYREH